MSEMKLTGARIAIVREEAAEKVGSIILPDQSKEKPRIGIVKVAGPGARNDKGDIIPMDVKVGDRILYQDYAGTEVEVEGVKYTLLNERDVLAVLGE